MKSIRHPPRKVLKERTHLHSTRSLSETGSLRWGMAQFTSLGGVGRESLSFLDLNNLLMFCNISAEAGVIETQQTLCEPFGIIQT